jgi:serine/threonine-protein kinase
MPDSRYRITERIAAGGMAEVFRGVAESLQGFRKNVAIKRILPALTKNEKFVTMFLDEAHLSLHLQHANIVQMFDIGHADDTYFIVMEYVDGVDLKAILDWRRRIGRRLTVGQTIYIIMEVCKGLAYAHDLTHPETGKPLGIVHRDVSPANVLFSRNGEVKLADFGLAKATSQIESTDPGVVKGKMSYLSPEAARGENVDRRADIFAVGILLYEMLTGKRLFYGDSDYQTVELVRNAKIPSIATQNPEVEGEFEEICRKALTKRVEDRFQTATDLQDALAHYLFSRGLKMIQRDIAELVRACLEDQAAQSSGGALKKTSVIDTIFHKEMDAFTSVEFEGEDTPMVHGQTASSEYIDPRNWSIETDISSPRSGRRETVGTFPVAGASSASRDTISEMPTRNTAGMPATLDPTRPSPSFAPATLQPSSINLPTYSPTVAPTNTASDPEPHFPLAIRKGLLISVMAIAVVIGATLAWLLVNAR